METKSFFNYLLSNITLNTDRIIEYVEAMSDGETEEMMSILSYLSGYSDIPEIPKKSTVCDSATLVSYDFFKNRVSYKYLETRTFKTENTDFDGQVYDSYRDIPEELRQNSGEFTATIKYWREDYCNLRRWLAK